MRVRRKINFENINYLIIYNSNHKNLTKVTERINKELQNKNKKLGNS